MSNQQTQNCFICSKKVTTYRHGLSSRTDFVCLQCGHYSLSDFLQSEESWVRPIMFYYLLHNTSDKTAFFVSREPSNKDEYDNANFITKEALESMRPKNLNEKIDMIMLNLGEKIKSWGDAYRFSVSGQEEIVVQHSILSSLLLVCDVIPKDLKSTKGIYGTLKFLEDYGFLTPTYGSNQEHTFTIDGWKYVGKLQSKKGELPQAFIAMWFDDSMSIFRESIKRAIVDSGYIPITIDEKEHNNQIVPEIFYEIQNSKFLIADLCAHRNGVYYEAGYAKGLGKEVILTCGADHFKDRHFDVAQQSIIIYEDAEDLHQRLLKRIEVTVGKRVSGISGVKMS